MLDALLQLIAGFVPLTYLVLDGHFGNHNALQMARQSTLHLISKLRCDAALYFPYAGPYAGRGPRRKYGSKVDYANMPEQYLKETTVEGHIQTRLYQAQLLHKEFAQPLNVVIIVKTNLRTQAQAHVILFSSDLTLAYASLVDYYGLRFQIEFNFRDAKQYWGLEDFMNVTPTGVTNAANLSLFMVNVAYRLQADVRQRDPDYSILDLKADCRGYKYVEETIQMLPEKPEPVLLEQILHKVAGLGRIHASQPVLQLFVIGEGIDLERKILIYVNIFVQELSTTAALIAACCQQRQLDLGDFDPIPADFHLCIFTPHIQQAPIRTHQAQVSRPVTALRAAGRIRKKGCPGQLRLAPIAR